MLRVFIVSCCLMIGSVFAHGEESNLETCLLQIIEQESAAISTASELPCEQLADLYASRGESYLIIGKDKEAFEDFQSAYLYAQNCSNPEEVAPLTFRSLLGAFLVSVRAEDLFSAQTLGEALQDILRNHTCEGCHEQAIIRASACIQLTSNRHPDWPVLGPEQIPLQDCLDNVKATTDALHKIIGIVKRAEVRLLAAMIIDGLADQAVSCCWAGGLWKGCLQKLVNKLHYWKVLGVPADPTWDD